MTRRLTISGSRSEMGLLEDSSSEPRTPPPSWTPAKHDFWIKPSKWQICMPRLRMVAKIIATLICLILVIKIMSTSPPPPPEPTSPLPAEPDAQPEPEPPREPTDDEMMEMAKRQDWIWKDFTTYVLTKPWPSMQLSQQALTIPFSLVTTD